MRRLLDRGAHRAALHAYVGPIMPRSLAPAVVSMRERAARRSPRRAAPPSRPCLLLAWIESPAGRDDVDAWRMLHACLPSSSGRGRRAGARALTLDQQLGA